MRPSSDTDIHSQRADCADTAPQATNEPSTAAEYSPPGAEAPPAGIATMPAQLAGPPRRLNGPPGPRAQRHRVGFLLIPGFSHIGFSSAIEPLRMANMVSSTPVFEALTASVDGQIVAASNGVETVPDTLLDELTDIDTLLVCGPNPIAFPQPAYLGHRLRRMAAEGVVLGGLDTGTVLLARAGLLDGYRCTIHWQDRESMLVAFPDIVVSDHLYEIDRNRLTSGGGTAAMDMMLHYIAMVRADGDLAGAAAALLVHDRIRTGRESQHLPLRHEVGMTRPKLRDAVTIMEANIEEPLALAELARHAGLSKRQLERLFAAELDCTPSSYYMQLRLNIARTRLRYSQASIAEVAHGCGFGSNSYFTRRYSRLFGRTPSAERRRHRASGI
ncbi:AraC family transcriptional regulator [Salinisphaera orenii MK-B5]|uniref:AraC family transcriptional regulator n=1 Tax=Salinisphaera orenii MK-B5 TaxID=856730 RepID=A0A423PN63_9GAMM|nr:GlxA family transcriptional regulator [Salinisphaera orenii]ROO27017.1 AraC family transcriptional regulator [Salinisphaera orenii MK-B5]